MEYKDIQWDSIDYRNLPIQDLNYIRRMSYNRYMPPNMYMMWGMLSGICFMFGGSLIYFRYEHAAEINYHRFYLMVPSMFVIGVLCIIMCIWRGKISNRKWKEMEEIRLNIDYEIKKRDRFYFKNK